MKISVVKKHFADEKLSKFSSEKHSQKYVLTTNFFSKKNQK